MYRRSGLLVLAIGAMLTYALAFTSFDEPVRRWVTSESGGLVQVEVRCPSAWAALIEGARLDTNMRTEAERCVRAARTHATGAVIVATLAATLGIRGVLRGPVPDPEPLPPLSELIRWKGQAGHRSAP